MKRVLAVIALACLGGCAADDDDVAQTDDAIVNGTIANGQHPEVALLSLVDAQGHAWVCSGTLVGSRTLLTARHCFEDGVIAPDGTCHGTVRIDTTGGGARRGTAYGIDRCVIPDLGDEGRSNDLALVRLDRPATGVVPARIARAAPRESLYTVYGYGGFGAARGGSCAQASDADNKRTVTYRGPLSWHFGRFVCPGDSGGPHFIAGTNLVAGVSSTATAFGVDVQAVPYRYAATLDAYVARLDAR